MKFIIPTPEQFANPSSEFNNPVIVQENLVETLIEKIFTLYKKNSLVMYSDLEYPNNVIWNQVTEKISAHGWRIGLKKIPDQPMGTMLLPGFWVVILESKDSISEGDFMKKLDLIIG
jgi:hypothetical protein